MLNLPHNNQLIFDSSEAIFQCSNSKCEHLTVANKKEIISGIIGKYKQTITFKQHCPKCKKGNLEEVPFVGRPFCPECKTKLLEHGIIGNWD